MSSDCIDSISIIVITSPSPSNPDTFLIDSCIESINNVRGLESCKVYIIMDGIHICSENRTKKGRVTEEMAENYALYHSALCNKYNDTFRFEIVKLPDHHGFAYGVHHGLSICNTKYAMIMQHDRAFRIQFNRLAELIQSFDKYNYLRYIGFTTSSNVTLDRMIASTCNLNILNNSNNKHYLGDSLYLQPCIFWYDSNHLCQVDRYLEIYKPFVYLPEEIKNRLGTATVKKMVLRKGDFIEDRFGQMQRISLTTQYKGEEDNDFIIKLFQWFGTYLCWESASEFPYEPHYDRNKVDTTIMVNIWGEDN